jgi:hypothetical protein
MDGLCLISSSLLHQKFTLQEIQAINVKSTKLLIIESLFLLMSFQRLILPTPTLHEQNAKARCNHISNVATLASYLHQGVFPCVWL